MIEIKQINTGVAELLVVKVQEGAHSFTSYRSSITDTNKMAFITTDITCIDIPPGKWTPLGLSTELTEDDVWSLVDGSEDVGFKDYMTGENCWLNAFESFETMLQANGCYSVNPIPQPEYQTDEHGNGGCCDSWVKEYQEAEANTGTCLILKLLS